MTDILINFPLAAGVIAASVHVVSGPDHLAAVTPLAIEVKNKSYKIGIFWGLGHILGMLLIGGAFTLLREIVEIPIEKISEYSEFIVGISLVIIGLWAFYKIRKSDKNHSHPHKHENEKGEYMHIHEHNHNDKQNHVHKHQKNTIQNIYAAVGIGTLHGFAGISHFLLFLPTLAFEKTSESVLYIGGFGLGTLIAMTLYTIVLGAISNKSENKHQDRLFLGLRFAGGLFAIIIGIYWMFFT